MCPSVSRHIKHTHIALKGCTPMTIPTHKLCPSCETTKPAECFSPSTGANGKKRLESYCKACKAAKKRERLATPEGRAKNAEANRRYYSSPKGKAKHAEAKHAEAKRRYNATPEGKARSVRGQRRYRATPKGREVHLACNRRYQARLRARFAAAFDHFEGRRGWEFVVAGTLVRHPQARAIQAYNDRFEQMAAWYVGDEEEPWVAEGDRVLLQAA